MYFSTTPSLTSMYFFEPNREMLSECLSVAESPYSFSPVRNLASFELLSEEEILGLEIFTIPSKFDGLSKLSNTGLKEESRFS